jgi:hypothetical protein
MKIVLQKCRDLQYLKRNGDWTDNHREAMSFHDTDDALAHCITNGLANMQVVMKFENSLYDVRLPVQDRILRESFGSGGATIDGCLESAATS